MRAINKAPWKWKVWIFCLCSAVAITDQARDCDADKRELCDTAAPWPSLWVTGNSRVCYENETFTCSHDCVHELSGVIEEGLYTVINDSVCDKRSESSCQQSRDFVWSCLMNDCDEIDLRSARCEECLNRNVCSDAHSCSQECVALFSSLWIIEPAVRCNCYTELDPKDVTCNHRKDAIKSCYQLYLEPKPPVIIHWVLLGVLGPVLLVLLSLGCVYYLRPHYFCNKKGTLETLAGSIVWDEVRELSKSKSKEVVLMLPYKYEHRTQAKVLKVFPTSRADVYQGEMTIHKIIGNCNRNIIAVHGDGVIGNDLLTKLHHKFSVIQQGTTVRYLMLHYCKQGSLLDVLSKRDMSLYKVLRVGLDICSALKYLQTHKIIHMDIKPANIFVTGGNRFLLGDFGMAIQVKDLLQNDNATHQGQLELKGGTYPYYPPEYIKRGGEYILPHAARDPMKIDVYQLGLLLWYCQIRSKGPGFKRRPPYNAEAEPYKGDKKVTLETMAALFTANPVCRPTFQEGSNQAIVSIITSCWEPSIAHRPHVTSLHKTLRSTLREEMIRCNFLCHQSQSVEVAVNNCVSPGASGEQRDYTIDLLSTNV